MNQELKDKILALPRPDRITAKYVIEVELEELMDLIETYRIDELKPANDVLRSAYQIASRLGKDTSWQAFTAILKAELDREHAVMYPPPSKQPTNGDAVGGMK